MESSRAAAGDVRLHGASISGWSTYPASTTRIAFEIRDSSFPDLGGRFSAEGCLERIPHDRQNSWGDVEIWLRRGVAQGNWAMTSRLYDALSRYYAERRRAGRSAGR